PLYHPSEGTSAMSGHRLVRPNYVIEEARVNGKRKGGRLLVVSGCVPEELHNRSLAIYCQGSIQ
ncbi:MAG: hypothetical protein WAM44_22430, partial [Chthoniobacterales bacterium]